MTRAAAMIEFINYKDNRLMDRVQRWRPPRWIRLWMVCATRGGDGWIWYAQGIVILLVGGPSRFSAVLASTVASATGIALFLSLKKSINRKRPSVNVTNWGKLLPPDHFSFPSGHSITAFAFTIPMILFYPSLATGLLFCAVSIAVSRVLLGMHFLSDVVAGCLIGTLLGYGSFLIFSV
jgi:undecaprenyl-diphosphatase